MLIKIKTPHVREIYNPPMIDGSDVRKLLIFIGSTEIAYRNEFLGTTKGDRKGMKIAKWLSAVLFVSYGSLTSAGIIIDINESGSDVVAAFNGSIDLNAVTFQFSPVGNTPGVIPSISVISFSSGDEQYVLNLISSDGTWGSGVTTLADSSSGDGFSFDTGSVILPAGYVSGNSIAGLMTFLAEDFTTMGLTAGVYNYTFGQVGAVTDFVTVNIGQEQIPAPATIALFGLGLGALAYRRRKRA